MQMTKKIFKDTVKSLQRDPSFLAEIVEVCLDTMPYNLAEYISKQAYIKYAIKDLYYEVHDILNDRTEYFITVQEIYEYILTKYPKAKKSSIYSAINRGQRAFNHSYKKIEPTNQ